ncbi:hypothetical protein DDE82_004917 [Stemphylium lycopersici]|nr:hypothetical protein DDE82_004917 [Stemphylium lycopersici]
MSHTAHVESVGRSPTPEETVHAEEGGVSLEGQMRSLSMTSDTSSFSLVSRTSRANSFHSVKSIDSQQSTSSQKDPVGPRSRASTKSSDSVGSHETFVSSSEVNALKGLSIVDKVPDTAHAHCMSHDSASLPAHKPEYELEPRPRIVEGHGSNPAWSKFPNFVPSPAASFKSEFGRLAQGQGWSKKQKRKQLVALLTSEVTFYWGADEGKLSHYQELCEDLGIKDVPTTITKCKKALKPFKINLYSMIDNRRNPEIRIVQYKSHKQLRNNIRCLRLWLSPKPYDSNIQTMASEILVSDAQQALLRQWTANTDFVLDLHDSPRRQFNILARRLGWVGGEELWNAHWKECFGEEYIWRGHPDSAVAPPSSDVTPAPSDSGSAGPISIWDTFKGFSPKPHAKFNSEFHRLAVHMRWTGEERRLKRVEVFDADWESHMGSDLGDLEMWQEFCRLCGIDPVPDTITGCMEALEDVLVNIYDLLDARRSGATSVRVFDTYDEFRDYTVHGHMYPVEEAKEDTFLPIFLKVIIRKHGD